MAQDIVHIALFDEDQLETVSEAISRLRRMGVFDRNMTILSGIPYSERILGRPMGWTRIGLIGLLGAATGVVISLLLNLGTPLLYPVRVGGMPLQPIPPTIVLTFELGMLGLMLSVFLGVLLETWAPTYGPKGYDPRVSDGHIGILFTCKPEIAERADEMLTEMGAELSRQDVEVKK
jgi:hypothetical protein